MSSLLQPLRSLVTLSLVVGVSACQSMPDVHQEELIAMPDTHFLTVPDGTLAYDVQGEGPLMILLPGLGDLRQSYRFLAPQMAAAGYQVVTMDLRGHGESSVPWPEYTTAASTSDVLALIDHLGTGPAILVANSFSAGVAVWAATERPEAVSHIAMIGPFVRDHDTTFVQKLGMRVLFNGPWKVRSWLWFHGTLFTDEKPADYDKYRVRLHTNLSEPGRFDAVKGMINRSDAAVEARLADVQVPTVVIMGTLDPDYVDPEEEAQWIADKMGGKVALIEDAGHYPQAEKPDQTVHILLTFLASPR